MGQKDKKKTKNSFSKMIEIVCKLQSIEEWIRSKEKYLISGNILVKGKEESDDDNGAEVSNTLLSNDLCIFES